VGEKLTTVGLSLLLDPDLYRRIDNVLVPAGNGTTQVDHVIVSIFGIFVIETKNMDGWIFGSAEQKSWTQSFGKKRFRFQNPLRQNYRHTRSMAEFLRLDHDVFHSVVFFIGDCELKTRLPENVLTSGLPRYVKPIFDSQRRFLLERSSTGAALRAIEVLSTPKCSAIYSANYRFYVALIQEPWFLL